MSSPQDSETKRNAIEKTREGARLLNAGDYEGAIDACTEAIRLDSQIDDAYLLRSEAYRLRVTPRLPRFISAPLLFMRDGFFFILRYLWWRSFYATDALDRAHHINGSPSPAFREHDQSRLAWECVERLLTPTAMERAEAIRGLGIFARATEPASRNKRRYQPGLIFVRKWQRTVVYRRGQVSRVLGPGMRFVIPLLEKARTVDLRDRVERFPVMEYMTQDQFRVNLDLVLYYRFLPQYAEQVAGGEQECLGWTRNRVWKELESTLASVTLAVVQQDREYIQNEILRCVNKLSQLRGIDILAVHLGQAQGKQAS